MKLSKFFVATILLTFSLLSIQFVSANELAQSNEEQQLASLSTQLDSIKSILNNIVSKVANISNTNQLALVSPIASLTVNGRSSIIVDEGNIINFEWSSTGGTSWSSNIIGSLPSCSTGLGIIRNASGSYETIVGANQGGCSYVGSYTVTGSDGATSSAYITVIVNTSSNTTSALPVANLTANGSSSVTVSVGDTVNWAWNSTGGTSWTRSYSGSPGCNVVSSSVANSANGSITETIPAGKEGCTPTYTYTVTGPSGTIRDSVTVIVNETSASTSGLPSLSFNATNSTIDQRQSTNLYWVPENATSCIATGGWSGQKSYTDPTIHHQEQACQII